MKRDFSKILILIAIITLCLSVQVRAQDEETPTQDATTDQDDLGVSRVGRLSYIQGDVSFLRSGEKDWAYASENLPLLTGDQVYTANGARAEIQLGRDSYIRLSENTAFSIVELSETAAQFEVTEGSAIVRVSSLASAFGRFEIDTPGTALVLENDGLYRINVPSSNISEVIVRQGSVDVTTSDGSFKLKQGSRLLIGGDGHMEVAYNTPTDNSDQWSSNRDNTVTRSSSNGSPDFVTYYENTYNSFYGVSDLSGYGTWTTYPTYGSCWIPNVSAGWAPYRNGDWLWIPSLGWSWQSYDRWGWAPYHYGRWAFLSGLGWAWVPGFNDNLSYRYQNSYYRSYYSWRPSLVYFFNGSSRQHGSFVGWYPLAPGERWHRFDHPWVNDHDRLSSQNRRDDWQRSHGYSAADRHGAISFIPVDGFNRTRQVRPDQMPGDLRSARGFISGLPALNPSSASSSPVPRGDFARGYNRPAPHPPSDVENRRVVTRNLPPARQAGEGTGSVQIPRRERTLVQPPIAIQPRTRDRVDSSSDTHQPGASNDSRSGRSTSGRPTGPVPPRQTPSLTIPENRSGSGSHVNPPGPPGRSQPDSTGRSRNGNDSGTTPRNNSDNQPSRITTQPRTDHRSDNGNERVNRSQPSSETPRGNSSSSQPRVDNRPNSTPPPQPRSEPQSQPRTEPRREPAPQPRSEPRSDTRRVTRASDNYSPRADNFRQAPSSANRSSAPSRPAPSSSSRGSDNRRR